MPTEVRRQSRSTAALMSGPTATSPISCCAMGRVWSAGTWGSPPERELATRVSQARERGGQQNHSRRTQLGRDLTTQTSGGEDADEGGVHACGCRSCMICLRSLLRIAQHSREEEEEEEAEEEEEHTPKVGSD